MDNLLNVDSIQDLRSETFSKTSTFYSSKKAKEHVVKFGGASLLDRDEVKQNQKVAGVGVDDVDDSESDENPNDAIGLLGTSDKVLGNAVDDMARATMRQDDFAKELIQQKIAEAILTMMFAMIGWAE